MRRRRQSQRIGAGSHARAILSPSIGRAARAPSTTRGGSRISRRLWLSAITTFLLVGCSAATTGASPAVGPTPPPAVVVTTDGSKYDRGSAVKIWVWNGLDSPIWYARQADCGLSFWLLEDCSGKQITYRMPCQWVVPQHDFTRLPPGETLVDEWNGRVGGPSGSAVADPGCYRVVVPYSTEEIRPQPHEWSADLLRARSIELRTE